MTDTHKWLSEWWCFYLPRECLCSLQNPAWALSVRSLSWQFFGTKDLPLSWLLPEYLFVYLFARSLPPQGCTSLWGRTLALWSLSYCHLPPPNPWEVVPDQSMDGWPFWHWMLPFSWYRVCSWMSHVCDECRMVVGLYPEIWSGVVIERNNTIGFTEPTVCCLRG